MNNPNVAFVMISRPADPTNERPRPFHIALFGGRKIRAEFLSASSMEHITIPRGPCEFVTHSHEAAASFVDEEGVVRPVAERYTFVVDTGGSRSSRAAPATVEDTGGSLSSLAAPATHSITGPAGVEDTEGALA